MMMSSGGSAARLCSILPCSSTPIVFRQRVSVLHFVRECASSSTRTSPRPAQTHFRLSNAPKIHNIILSVHADGINDYIVTSQAGKILESDTPILSKLQKFDDLLFQLYSQLNFQAMELEAHAWLLHPRSISFNLAITEKIIAMYIRKNKEDSALSLVAAILDGGRTPTESASGMLLSLLKQKGLLQEMAELYRKLRTAGAKLSMRAHTTLLSALSQDPAYSQHVIDILDIFRGPNYAMDTAACNMALVASTRLKLAEYSEYFIQKFKSKEIAADQATMSLLTKNYSEFAPDRASLQRAQKVTLPQLFQTVRPDDPAEYLNAQIAFAAQKNDIALMKQTLEQLREAKLDIEPSKYLSAINMFASEDQLEVVQTLTSEMVERGLPISLEVYNATLKVFASNEDSTHVKSILQIMHEQRIFPDEITYLTIFPRWSSNKGVDLSEIEGLREMLEAQLDVDAPHHIPPSQKLFNAVLQGHQRFPESLPSVLELFKKWNVVPDERTYSMLIDAYVHAGNINAAVRQLQEMMQAGILPDIVTLTPLFKEVIRAENLELLRRLMDTVEKHNIEYDAYGITVLVKFFLQRRDRAEVQRLCAKIDPETIDLSEVHYLNILIHAFFFLSDYRNAGILLNRLDKDGPKSNELSRSLRARYIAHEGSKEQIRDFVFSIIASRSARFVDGRTLHELFRALARHQLTKEMDDFLALLDKFGVEIFASTLSLLIEYNVRLGRASELSVLMNKKVALGHHVSKVVLAKANALLRSTRQQCEKTLARAIRQSNSQAIEQAIQSFAQNRARISTVNAMAIYRFFSSRNEFEALARITDTLLEKQLVKLNPAMYELMRMTYLSAGNPEKASALDEVAKAKGNGDGGAKSSRSAEQ